MRVAVAGLGLRAGHVLSILKAHMPEIRFAGYVDPSPAGRAALDPDMPEFDDLAGMLRDTAPDLLFVGSPNHLHLDHIRAGLRAGVRVFAEKPVVI